MRDAALSASEGRRISGVSTRITLSELETYLYASADILRGHVEASDYKSFVFPLLFFKRICDVYDEETANTVKEYGEMGAKFMGDDIHRFIVPEGHHWRDVRNCTENIGIAIKNAFYAIEQANEDSTTHEKRLVGVFGDAPWANKAALPDETLKNLIEHFSTKSLTIANCPEDELGQAYEYLIKKFGDDSGHTSQEFYTNRTVVHLMTELLKPQPGETVYDPTCGSAGMLISCIHYLREHGAEWRSMKCFGQEINPLSTAIGKMNLFLNGVSSFKIVNADTLKNPAFTENGQLKQFDIVLANPPYSISEWNRYAFETDPYGRNFLGTPPQGNADYAFFQHILKSLKPNGGRCAILFPHGVLTRDDEYEMRKKLIQLDWIECIIGIGKNLFYNSPMEACIVICNTGKASNRKGKILFINARNEVTRKNAQSYLEDSHIQRITAAYNNFATEELFSSAASIEHIAEEKNNYSLGISKYVTGAIDPPASKEELALAITRWLGGSGSIHEAYKHLNEMIAGGEQNGAS
jgi:type I restriction enzyme M protein